MVCTCSLVAGIIVSFVLYKLFFRRKATKTIEILEKHYEKDVVYLYQFPRYRTIPNISPFCLKLEAFLRLHKIKYENRFSMRSRSKYGLLPFIELNGEHLADSQLIEEKLKKHFNIQSNLSKYDDAVGRAAARLVSHHTSPICVKYKLVDETDVFIDIIFELAGFPTSLAFLKPLGVFIFKRKATKRLQKTVGRFSNEEFELLLRKDLDVLKELLGEKMFFFGDTITDADASIFGHVATWYYTSTKSELVRILDEDYPTIVSWAKRIQQELFTNDFTQH